MSTIEELSKMPKYFISISTRSPATQLINDLQQIPKDHFLIGIKELRPQHQNVVSCILVYSTQEVSDYVRDNPSFDPVKAFWP